MKIIPVMDLMSGVVVHARRGERDNYQPIRSTLCPSAAPEAILQALVENFHCATVYIADLDAIRFNQPQLKLIENLKRRFEHINFWLDAGISNQQQFLSLQSSQLATPVVGSESLQEINWLSTLEKQAWVLSLDFKDAQFLGDPLLLEHCARWPQRVIAMNLACVGSGAGPDVALLSKLQRRNPSTRLFAAGGVRHRGDLIALEENNIHGALIATALHDGSIKPTELPISDDQKH